MVWKCVAGFTTVFLLACSGCGGDNSERSLDAGPQAAAREGAAPQTADMASEQTSNGEPMTFGKVFEGGQFHLGPVDFAETEWHNACAPTTKYANRVRELEGTLLAGLWNGIPDVASYCDACIAVETAHGKSALLRVVTYGDTSPNSIDVSPEAYALLDSGEYPRAMTFQFAKCPDTGNVLYEFQTGSSEWWTSLWVRNARLPITKVEVKSSNHASYVALERGSDGTLTDAAGFGRGEFSLRLTALDGQEYSDTFPWPADGIAGKTLEGKGNFP